MENNVVNMGWVNQKKKKKKLVLLHAALPTHRTDS